MAIAGALLLWGGLSAAWSAESASDTPFVARTKHLLAVVARYPAPADKPWFTVNGAMFWPATTITAEALDIVRKEVGTFNKFERDQLLLCSAPPTLPDDTRAVAIEVQGSRITVPVFLTPKSNGLRYVELSLDMPGPPVALIVTGYDGIALRVTTAPGTTLAAVHLHTYYPNAVLGVDAIRVTQQYYNDEPGNNCRYGTSGSSQIDVTLRQAGFDPATATRFQIKNEPVLAIGRPQAAIRGLPTLGTFLDPEMPAPHNYGIVVLNEFGYISAKSVSPDLRKRIGALGIYEVLKPFQFPPGLHGSHGVTFVMGPTAPMPTGDPGHSSFYGREER